MQLQPKQQSAPGYLCYRCPVQYATKAEQDGTVDQYLLDENPGEYSLNVVCSHTKLVEDDSST
jgi:hypothetical protein